MNLFDYADLPVSPWRNGGGETREITSQPLGLVDFHWRASIATIAQDGPFSAFPGIDRSITLLAGDGVHLYSEGMIDHRLQNIAEPFAFSGDTALDAILLGGSSQDFNIMTRRGGYSAQVQTVTKNKDFPPLHAGVLYVLQGNWLLPDGKLLRSQQGCWWLSGKGPSKLIAQENSALALWADIQPG